MQAGEAQRTPQVVFGMAANAIMDQFVARMDGLSELVESLAPHVASLDDAAITTKAVRDAMSRMRPSEVKKVARAFESNFAPPNAFDFSNFLNKLIEEHSDRPWFFDLYIAFREISRRPRREDLLNGALLTSIVATFEAMVSRLVTEFYQATPGALEAVPREREKEFSLKDLKYLGSIEDAVDLAISNRVDELLFGGLSKWQSFFKTQFSLSFEELAHDWTSLREIFQRRHVIVHNGGLATRLYVTRMSKIDPESTRDVGDYLSCSDRYLREAIDQFTVLGASLITGTVLKVSKEPTQVLETLQAVSYRALVNKRYLVAQELSRYGEAAGGELSSTLIFKVNAWLARLALGDESVGREVLQWDVSGLEDTYKLAKLCLMGEHEDAVLLVKRLISTDRISLADLTEWPLFADLREMRAFIEIVDAAKAVEARAEIVMAEKSSVFHLGSCLRKGNAIPVSWRDIAKRSARPCKSCNPDLPEGAPVGLAGRGNDA